MDLYDRLLAKKKAQSEGHRDDDSDTESVGTTETPIGGRVAGEAMPLSRASEQAHENLRSLGFDRAADLVWTRTRSLAVEPIPDRGTRLLMDCGFEELVYFDTETTGLSGGSGTTVFLVGVGRLEGRRLVVTQLFLEDFPGEPEFLELLSEILPVDGTYVSYNGKAFDAHMLSTRYLMNGRHFAIDRHLDLLYPARRLWKSLLDGCSLSDIEEHILEVSRDVDIPGYLIPDTYFDFLRTGDAAPLGPVFEHHATDIVSLHRLLSRIESLAVDPFSSPADRFQLARLLMLRFPDRGELLLRAISGAEPAAALELGRLLKRTGRFDEAHAVYDRLYREHGSATAGIELAKHLEHRTPRQSRSEALSLAREIVSSLLLRPDCARLREPLRHRLDRLERKITAL